MADSKSSPIVFLGRSLEFVGWAVWAIFGLWGFVLCLGIVRAVAGFWGVVIGFTVAPVTFAAAPWYALVAWGTWLPLVVCYGGGIGGMLLLGLGSSMAE